MKVLLYTVFKDLAAAGVVTRMLMVLRPLRMLVPNRTFQSAAISLKTTAARNIYAGLWG
jgi:hypothetical protein